MQKVLPLRTAPSQMIASRVQSGEAVCHHPSTRRCLGENDLISRLTSRVPRASADSVKQSADAAALLADVREKRYRLKMV